MSASPPAPDLTEADLERLLAARGIVLRAGEAAGALPTARFLVGAAARVREAAEARQG